MEDRQVNGHRETDRMINNDQQSPTDKLRKGRQHELHYNTGVNSGASDS